MQLTQDSKDHIDNLTDEELLFILRTARDNDPLLKGDTGTYINQRLTRLFEDMNSGLETE